MLIVMGKHHGSQVGIEAQIKSAPILEKLGFLYESWRRTAINWMQTGLTENEVEKRLQSDLNIQWAWADSIATEAAQTLSQLKTAKLNNIEGLKARIKAKLKKAKLVQKQLSTELKKATKNGFPDQISKHKFKLKMMGQKSRLLKIASLKKSLARLQKPERLHVCFGSRKLFKAQYHLEENGYKDHQEWQTDWVKHRSGRFYCVGKSVLGGGTMMKIFPTDAGYELEIKLPRCMHSEYGAVCKIPFQVSDRKGRYRQQDLDYALASLKPITTQVFRREHKSDQWYVHLTTYVQDIPSIHQIKNGCLGLDLNASSISASVISLYGELEYYQDFKYEWKGLTSGQRKAHIRDIVAQIVLLAESFNCGISIESLDFSKKKSRMSEESKQYNSMLSNLATDLFETAIESRCRRRGVQLKKVNPAYTSVIGMINFMVPYGLNSGTAAAMAIAYRAMNLHEDAPICLTRPEDLVRHNWCTWRLISNYLKLNRIRRHQLFQWEKALKGFIENIDNNPFKPVSIGKGDSKNRSHSPMVDVSSNV